MKIFEADFVSVLIRFYTMMLIVIASYALGYYLLAGLAIPIFLTAMMAMQFKKKQKTVDSGNT